MEKEKSIEPKLEQKKRTERKKRLKQKAKLLSLTGFAGYYELKLIISLAKL